MADNTTLFQAQQILNNYYNQLDNASYDDLPAMYPNTYKTMDAHRFYIARKIKQDIQDALNYKTRYNDTFSIIDQFLQGQPTGPIDMEGKPLFTVDLGNEEATSIVLQKSALFDFNSLDIQLKPRKPDSRLVVAKFNDYINSYLCLPMFRFAFADAVKTSRAYPFAVTMLGWDDKAIISAGGVNTNTEPGDVVIKNIDPYRFFWDPLCYDLSDASFCFYTDIINFDKFYSALKTKGIYAFSDPDLAWAVHICKNNMNSLLPEIRSRLVTNYDRQEAGGEEIIVYFLRDFDNKVVNVYFIMNNNCLVAKTTIKCSELPFSILKEHYVEQSFLGKSSVMLAMPYIKQKMIIDATAQSITMLLKTPVYLVPKTAGISPNALLDVTGANGPKVVFTNADPSTSAVMLNRGSLTQDTLAWRQEIDADMQKVVGINDAQSGYGFGSATNGAAVNAMVQQATMRENDSLVELNKYIVRVVNILIQLLQRNLFNNSITTAHPALNKKGKLIKLKTRKATVRVDNPDPNRSGFDTFKFYEFDERDIRDLQLDVNIDVESLRISKQQQQRSDLMTLMQWSMQYQSQEPVVTAEELIDVLNIPNKGAVLNRLDQSKMQAAIEKGAQILQIYDQMLQDPNLANLPKDQAYLMAASVIRAKSMPREEPSVEQIGAQVDKMQSDAADQQAQIEQAIASGQAQQQYQQAQQQDSDDAQAYLAQMLQQQEGE